MKFLNIDLLEDGDAIEDCESLIIRLCHGKGIILDSRDIVRAHRTGPIVNNKPAIIVKFTHYKDKQKILKLKSTFFNDGLLVIKDFPPEFLQKRKIFSPILRAAHNSNGKYRARLVVDRLLVNGKQYSASEIDKLPPDLNPKNLATVSRGNITAFFTASSPLSNHHSCSFKLQNQNFASVEQYFMYCKASHFQDEQKAREILDTDNPKTAKALGRQVSNFDKSAWFNVCDRFMKDALIAKYTQNPNLGKFLKDTGESRLVEANPND